MTTTTTTNNNPNSRRRLFARSVFIKNRLFNLLFLLLTSATLLALTSSQQNPSPAAIPQASSTLPYKQYGLSDKQAAAYMLDRFAFGARAGDVEAVATKGVAVWFDEQLQAALPETALDQRLSSFTTLKMSVEDILTTYPNPAMVLARAKRDGINLKELADTAATKGKKNGQDEYRDRLRDYAQKQGWKPQKELLGEMYAQKILRAVYAENQLAEVMTDFWFNHFNVSITDNQARPFVLAYERDAIRINALGNFRQLLGATAKHPAMLQYLDNAQSTAPDGTPTTVSEAVDNALKQVGKTENAKKRIKARQSHKPPPTAWAIKHKM
jgi:uncharacterized protein (DUF1800 family)